MNTSIDLQGNSPFVSVVMTVLNVGPTLQDCLRSLMEQDYPKDRYEIIVVDGGSSDGTEEVLKQYPVRTLSAPGTSIGGGRNRGIEIARGEIICITDGDMIAEKSWISNLVKPLSNPTVGAVGGPNLSKPNSPRFATLVGLLPEETPWFPDEREVNHLLVYTRNAAYRKVAIEQAGGFNEGVIAGEDPELNWRIRQLGYRLKFVPGALVWHHHRSTLRGFLRQHYRNGVGVGQLGRINPRALKTPKHLASCGGMLLALLSMILGPIMQSIALQFIFLTILLLFFTMALWEGANAFRRTGKIRHVLPVAVLEAVWMPIWLLGYIVGLFQGGKLLISQKQ